MTFDDRTTVATGTGELHLIRRSLAMQVRLIEDVADLLGTRVGLDGLHCFRNADAEDMTLMQGLTHDGIVDAQITRERIDLLGPWWTRAVACPTLSMNGNT